MDPSIHRRENYDCQGKKCHQICFHFIIDTTFPMNNPMLRSCLKAIENVLFWAVNVYGEALFYGLSLVNSTVHHVIKHKSSAMSFSISQDLRGALDFAKKTAEVPITDFEDALYLSVRGALRDIEDVHFVVLSHRDGQVLSGTVRTIQNTMASKGLSSMQVVELALGGCPRPRLEAALQKAWGSVVRPPALSLRLDLPSPHGLTPFLALECHAAACLLSPLWLPSWAWDRFLLDGQPTRASRSSSPQRAAGPSRDPSSGVRMRAVSRVRAEGVCEASLFGMPLRLTAGGDGTRERNTELFSAVCQSLLASDENLIAKIVSGGADDFGGHFVLIPGDEHTLLMRSIASAEQVLQRPVMSLPPNLSFQAVGCLEAVPLIESYRAEDFPSGLFEALSLNAHFPTHQHTHFPRKRRPRIPSTGIGASPSPPDSTLPRDRHVVQNEATIDISDDDRNSKGTCHLWSPEQSRHIVDSSRGEAELQQDDSSLDETFSLDSSVEEPHPPRGDPRTPIGNAGGQRARARDSSSEMSEPAHRLGTGGHPALEGAFQGAVSSRRKKPLLPPFRKTACSSVSARRRLL